MDGIELFLLGRALMKLGEEALPEPPGGSGQYASGTRSVVIVAGDIAAHPDTTVGETAQRTGLPQSQVSGAVARLREAGTVQTAPDPADRRRTLVRQSPGASARVAAVRAAGSSKVEEALARALGQGGAERLPEVTEALELLARHLAVRGGGEPR
ncbi:helix-turn-helix domain-containing protein [Streptomyces sp. NBC_00091]|uniref:MarR family transcriptional regulator n=1 Tax=Streptomyces sp. NBC_00091 TaxID=2975648 RepID=UPI0022597114|nr:helix-turn-helix domain-containing protein [Streptomyces sp. NBC_00091]MCX5381121.1 MarR family transcriptional regulator [Streptomyces sp. NBC_00091]